MKTAQVVRTPALAGNLPWGRLSGFALALLLGGLALTSVREARASGKAGSPEAGVSAAVAGTVTAVRVVAGQAVKKGDVLVTLDDELAEARLNLAEASFVAASASARAWGAESSGTPTEGREVGARARAQAEAVRAEAEAARAALDLAALELYETKVHAPRNGIVGRVTVATGTGVVVGQPLVWL